jgi:FtsH-binding integral membrane protein
MIQQPQHRRLALLLALIAIAFAIVLMLIPHAHDMDRGAVLPILFVGLISPLSLLSPLTYIYLGRTPDTPVLPASFQRPPPLLA